MTPEVIEEFIAYLENTLIPDLKESGHEYTAEDFEKCIAIMRNLMIMVSMVPEEVWKEINDRAERERE
jgi:hypothetical protein